MNKESTTYTRAVPVAMPIEPYFGVTPNTISIQGHVCTTVPHVKDIEIILSPDATIIKDKHLDRKTVVKKCEDDDENRELAVTFGLLKLLGLTPAQVQRMMANAKDYREPKKGKKNEKKNTND